MSKMTDYIVAGVKADDEKTFMKRVAILLERNGLVSQLADGVVVSAYVNDNDKCITKLSTRNKTWTITKILGCEMEREGSIRVKYEYSKKCWFKTQEDAEKGAKGWGVYTSDEQKESYPIAGSYNSQSSDNFSPEYAKDYGVELEVI